LIAVSMINVSNANNINPSEP